MNFNNPADAPGEPPFVLRFTTAEPGSVTYILRTASADDYLEFYFNVGILALVDAMLPGDVTLYELPSAERRGLLKAVTDAADFLLEQGYTGGSQD